VLSTIAFVKHITLEMRQLVYVDFKEGKTKTVDPFAAPATVWDWEPLKYQVKGFKKMELELKWRLGEPIGVMELTLGTFTQMDEQLLVLFHTVAALIDSAVVDLEHLTPGDTPPLASQQAVLLEYSKARFGVADILQKEMEMQLLTFSPIPIFCEIASFEARALDFQQARALKSVFVLLGACTKSEAETMEWKGIKKICSRHVFLYEAMRSFCAPLDTREMRQLWQDSNAFSRGLDVAELCARAAAPVVVLLKWLESARMVRNISIAMEIESKPPPADAAADKVFDSVDTNKDGKIDAQELIVYLAGEFPSKVGHTLVRTLDADGNGVVDRNEWRRAWAEGMLNECLIREHEKLVEKRKAAEEEDDAPKLRARTKQSDVRAPGHSSGIMELTVAIAAKQWNLGQQKRKEAKEAAAASGVAPRPKSAGKKKKDKYAA